MTMPGQTLLQTLDEVGTTIFCEHLNFSKTNKMYPFFTAEVPSQIYQHDWCCMKLACLSRLARGPRPAARPVPHWQNLVKSWT